MSSGSGAFGEVFKLDDEYLKMLHVPNQIHNLLKSGNWVVKRYKTARALEEETENYKKIRETMNTIASNTNHPKYSVVQSLCDSLINTNPGKAVVERVDVNQILLERFVLGYKLDDTHVYMQGCDNVEISSDNLLNYARQMYILIQIFHECGLAHLDIKTQNFISCDGKVSMIDFGTAVSLNEDEPTIKTNTIKGSPGLLIPGMGFPLTKTLSEISKYDPDKHGDNEREHIKTFLKDKWMWANRLASNGLQPQPLTPKTMNEYFDENPKRFDYLLDTIIKNWGNLNPQINDYYALLASVFWNIDRIVTTEKKLTKLCSIRKSVYKFGDDILRKIGEKAGSLESSQITRSPTKPSFRHLLELGSPTGSDIGSDSSTYHSAYSSPTGSPDSDTMPVENLDGRFNQGSPPSEPMKDGWTQGLGGGSRADNKVTIAVGILVTIACTIFSR